MSNIFGFPYQLMDRVQRFNPSFTALFVILFLGNLIYQGPLSLFDFGLWATLTWFVF